MRGETLHVLGAALVVLGVVLWLFAAAHVLAALALIVGLVLLFVAPRPPLT